MQGSIGGFIIIINYGSVGEAPSEQFELITENNFDILTESGNELTTQ